MEKPASAMKRVLTAFMGLSCLGSAAWAETVTYQNGLNGYTGTEQLRFTGDGGAVIDVDTVSYKAPFFSGYLADPVDLYKVRYGLFRFNNIIGTGAGQIPPGSTIVSARFELRTYPDSVIKPSAKSADPFVVARLLWYMPFIPNIPVWTDDATDWYSFTGGNGPVLGSDYDRPVGGFIDELEYGTFETADVTQIVQTWAKSLPGADNRYGNYGLLMMGMNVPNVNGDVDYWTVEGINSATPSSRPQLIVEYVATQTRTLTFQQGTGGYAGCSMLRVGQDNTTLQGASIDVSTGDAYLDGSAGPPDVEYDALIKFDSIFGSAAGQIPASAQIVKAFLAITTGPKTSAADAARSSGPYTAHQLLVDVDWTGTNHPAKPFLWSEFANADGPTVGDDLSATISGIPGTTVTGAQAMAWEGRSYLDVTSAVQAWKNGTPNYGLAIKPQTTDGWKINWLSVTNLSPKLLVLIKGKPADFDHNTHVDDTDLTTFLGCAKGAAVPYAAGCGVADLDDDQDVDMTDFAIFQACYTGPVIVASPECSWDNWGGAYE